MSSTVRILARIAFWCAGIALVLAGAVSIQAAEMYGGFRDPMAFLLAEMGKRDSATLNDAVQEIWQMRVNQDSSFCKAMTAKPEDFRLWCSLLARACSEAASDTALEQAGRFRTNILDPKQGLLSRPSKCSGLDSAIVAQLKLTAGSMLTIPPVLSSDQASRKIAFWNVMWQHRSGLNRRRYGRPMVELLSQFPNEFYDAFGGATPDYKQFVGSLDEIYFTALNKSECDRLELSRQGLIARLESGIVGNRFKTQNDQVIKRLKAIVVRSID